MSFETERLIELLTAEFMTIKSRGVDLKRRMKLPVLDKLAEVEPGLDAATAGSIIIHFLTDRIESLPERLYYFEGKKHTASKMKAAFYLELRIETGACHEARWLGIMDLLGLGYSHTQWRKDPRLERGFLRILAEHTVSRSSTTSV